MGSKVFLNGEFIDSSEAKISIFDHGLLYGDGVFEGIRSYGRKVFRLDEHIDRLYESAEAIRLTIPFEKKYFEDRIVETLKLNGLDDAYIRVVVTRGAGDLGLDPRKCGRPTVFIVADRIKLYPQKLYDEGLPITIARTRRNHPITLDPRIKSLNYLNNILARIEAIDAGVEEALMLTLEGYVVECTGDNIFFVKNGRLITPPSDIGALEGVTQDLVIDLAARRGIETERKLMKPEEIPAMHECFLTGTAAELIPVIRVDDIKIGTGVPGPLYQKLLSDFRRLTGEEGVPY